MALRDSRKTVDRKREQQERNVAFRDYLALSVTRGS